MTVFANSVILVLGLARLEARAGRAAEIEPDHLLLGLGKLCRSDLGDVLGAGKLGPAERQAVTADAERVRERFARAGVDPRLFRRRLRAVLAAGEDAAAPDAVPHRSRAASRVFIRAGELAAGELAGAEDLLHAVVEGLTPRCRELFAEFGVEKPLAAFFPEQPAQVGQPAETPFIDQYGRDLSRLAREGKLQPLVGRSAELRTLARVLVRQRKANAVLVGDAGVGKTGIVEELAKRLLGPGAPSGLSGARVVELSMAALVAGAKYRGEFEERLEGVLKEARSTPELILFIDELHTVLGAGGRGASDAANILKPALARGDLRCVGATTAAEYRRHIESDPALQRRFDVIWIEEPSRAEAVEILLGVRASLASHHGVDIGVDVPEAAVDLTVRHLPEQRLPDKAIDVVDQACAAARISTLSPEGPAQEGPVRIGRAEVAAVVAARARLPVERVAAGEARRLLRMEEQLRRRVVGQDEAVGVVAEAVRTARSGLGDPRRPLGVFLFAGPTGTGKTELAKALAEFMFEDERRLIRIDMSEYQSQYSVSRLLGAPPGYIGHDREGQLSGPLRDHPHSVVLFDEVEKAHPEVLDIFLQIFDEGRLTDSQGRRVPFSEAVVILTSNLGAAPAAEARPAGFSPAGPAAQPKNATERVMAALRRELRPELLGRIGRVVVFEPLTAAALRQILGKILDQVRERLADRSITLTLTDTAYELLLRHARAGARAGARALEQTVDRLLVQPLGRALLSQPERFGDGAALWIDAADGALAITPKENQAR